MGGRPRKPNAIKKLVGRRPGKDSAGRPLPEEPGYSRSLPPPPALLKKEGLAEWKRLGPQMLKQGVLTEADWAIFFQYCNGIQRLFDIARVQNKTKTGSEEWHKLDRARDRCEKQVTKAETELGLTPTTRSKVSIIKDEEPKKAELLAFDGGKK